MKALDTLGLAYLQRVRETGDPTYYPKAQGILDEALQQAPHDLIATAGLGQLALSRHQFRKALDIGYEAKRISPTTAGVYGVIGDAEIELGRYPQAIQELQPHGCAQARRRLLLARVVCARAASADIGAAERAMRLAASAAVGEQEASSWTHVQLGLLYLGHSAAEARARADGRRTRIRSPTYYVRARRHGAGAGVARPPSHRDRLRAHRGRPRAAAGTRSRSSAICTASSATTPRPSANTRSSP